MFRSSHHDELNGDNRFRTNIEPRRPPPQVKLEHNQVVLHIVLHPPSSSTLLMAIIADAELGTTAMDA